MRSDNRFYCYVKIWSYFLDTRYIRVKLLLNTSAKKGKVGTDEANISISKIVETRSKVDGVSLYYSL